jgi:hypothetical protein
MTARSWRYDLIAAGRWIKDHAPAFTISAVALTALWGAIALACVTLYIWDASFYRSLAPPGMELTFQSAGVVFRTFVIFGGLTIVWMKAQKLPGAATATLRAIWSMALIACCVAALGFVSEGNDYHYRKTSSVQQTETVTVESADARLKRIDAEKTAIRADRDRLVSGARESMRLVLSDGIGGNDDLKGFEAQIATYEDDARKKLSALDQQIAAIEGERLTARTTATAESVGDPGLPAVFRFPDRYIPGWDGIGFRDAFALFWVVLLELCGSVGAQALLSVQIAMSKRLKAQEAGSEGGRASAKAKMRRLITYANAAQATAVSPKPDDANGAADNGN